MTIPWLLLLLLAAEWQNSRRPEHQAFVAWVYAHAPKETA